MLIFLPLILLPSLCGAVTQEYIHFVGGNRDEMVREIPHTFTPVPTPPRNTLGGRRIVDQHTTRGNKYVRQVPQHTVLMGRAASKGKVAYESNKREACRGLHTVNSILHYKGRGRWERRALSVTPI